MSGEVKEVFQVMDLSYINVTRQCIVVKLTELSLVRLQEATAESLRHS